jgi:DnaJ-class molecular chaperone
MTRKEWEQITKAAQLLGLGEQATLDEIKKAFRHLSKKHHPDLKKTSKQSAERIEMHKLTEAYQLLLEFCASYAFPLVRDEDESLEGEDWWFKRFGQDHLG